MRSKIILTPPLATHSTRRKSSFATTPLLPSSSASSLAKPYPSSKAKGLRHHATTSHISFLPNEVILYLLGTLPTASLAHFRLVSKRMQSMANYILLRRYAFTLLPLERLLAQSEQDLRIWTLAHGEDMRRFGRFLSQASLTHISEAVWYTQPPSELNTVCECLCLLFLSTRHAGPPPLRVRVSPPRTPHPSPTLMSATAPTIATADLLVITPLRTNAVELDNPEENGTEGEIDQERLQDTVPNTDEEGIYLDERLSPTVARQTPEEEERMSWVSIKKIMGKFTFRRWVQTLSDSCDSVTLPAVRRVERLISRDMDITYERLREVSEPGYQLLILVAACLQQVPLVKTLNTKQSYCQLLEDTLMRTRSFVACLKGGETPM